MKDVLGLGDWRDGLPTHDRLGREMCYWDKLFAERDEDTGDFSYIGSSWRGVVCSCREAIVFPPSRVVNWSEPATVWWPVPGGTPSSIRQLVAYGAARRKHALKRLEYALRSAWPGVPWDGPEWSHREDSLPSQWYPLQAKERRGYVCWANGQLDWVGDQ